MFGQLESSGEAPYLVPYGGSSPIGALGYVYAMQEYISQNVPVDWIIFACSSGGTQAGLICGARMFGFHGQLLGICIDEPKPKLQVMVAKLASSVSLLGRNPSSFQPDEIIVNADYCSAGYGIFTDLEKNAIKLFAEYEGILLDPVYTGRAAGGLLDLIGKGFIKKSSRVLFWHTGGQPALFASAYTGTI